MELQETRELAYERRHKIIDGEVVSEAWLNKKHGFPCLGFYTAPEHRGNGYASQLAEELLKGKRLVFAKASSSRSAHILRKLDFKKLMFNRWIYLG